MSPGRKLLAAAGNPNVRIFDATLDGAPASAALHRLEGHQGNVVDLGFHPDARFLYTGSEDGTAKIWDLRQTGRTPSRDYLAGAMVNAVMLNPRNSVRQCPPVRASLMKRAPVRAVHRGPLRRHPDHRHDGQSVPE